MKESQVVPKYSFTIISSHTPPTDPALTLGVEVTDRAAAFQCGAGNVDGQHGADLRAMNYGSFIQRRDELARWDGLAAVQIAAKEAIPLPIDPVTTHARVILTTTKPDVDSIAAMAVIVLKNEGLWPDEKRESEAYAVVMSRVALIAERDNFSPGGAWVPRPLPTMEAPWPTGPAPVEETESLAALAVLCSPMRGQHEEPLSLRVAVVACWLLFGEDMLPSAQAPNFDIRLWNERMNVFDHVFENCTVPPDPAYTGLIGQRRWGVPDWYLRPARSVARKSRWILAADIATGATKIRVGLGNPPAGGSYFEGDGLTISVREYENDHSYTGQQARLAVVDYGSGGALGVGYCFAPVVVATGLLVEGAPGRHFTRKYTIAAWSPKYLDFVTLLVALNAAEREAGGEPAWGGNLRSGIVGSPQANGSMLTEERVIQLVNGALPAAT